MPVKFKSLLFLTAVFLSSGTSCQNHNNCSKFKIGRFLFHSKFDNSTTIIERNDSIQTETNLNSGVIVKSKVKWTGECEYLLTYYDQSKKSSDSIVLYVQTHPLITKILKTGKDYYIFQSSMGGVDQMLTDTLKVLK